MTNFDQNSKMLKFFKKKKLRYYDSSSSDSIVKGIIDLSDVESINQGLSSTDMQQQNATNSSHLSANNPYLSSTKKALNGLIGGVVAGADMGLTGSDHDSKSCFELKTSKRVYYFCAKSPTDAYKWVKQLEMCCLDS